MKKIRSFLECTKFKKKLFSLKFHIMSIILELSIELFCSVLLQDVDL